jgi:DNA-binding protein H-NS
MAKTLAQIEKQIAALKREAEAIRAKEMLGVIERIRDAVGHYGLTVEHIFGVRAAEVAPPRATSAADQQVAGKRTGVTKSASTGKRLPVKYRDDRGNTWSGRGRRPHWLSAAIQDGMSLEDFAVNE